MLGACWKFHILIDKMKFLQKYCKKGRLQVCERSHSLSARQRWTQWYKLCTQNAHWRFIDLGWLHLYYICSTVLRMHNKLTLFFKNLLFISEKSCGSQPLEKNRADHEFEPWSARIFSWRNGRIMGIKWGSGCEQGISIFWRESSSEVKNAKLSRN